MNQFGNNTTIEINIYIYKYFSLKNFKNFIIFSKYT